jgi:hypothetical protein
MVVVEGEPRVGSSSRLITVRPSGRMGTRSRSTSTFGSTTSAQLTKKRCRGAQSCPRRQPKPRNLTTFKSMRIRPVVPSASAGSRSRHPQRCVTEAAPALRPGGPRWQRRRRQQPFTSRAGKIKMQRSAGSDLLGDADPTQPGDAQAPPIGGVRSRQPLDALGSQPAMAVRRGAYSNPVHRRWSLGGRHVPRWAIMDSWHLSGLLSSSGVNRKLLLSMRHSRRRPAVAEVCS